MQSRKARLGKFHDPCILVRFVLLKPRRQFPLHAVVREEMMAAAQANQIPPVESKSGMPFPGKEMMNLESLVGSAYLACAFLRAKFLGKTRPRGAERTAAASSAASL